MLSLVAIPSDMYREVFTVGKSERMPYLFTVRVFGNRSMKRKDNDYTKLTCIDRRLFTFMLATYPHLVDGQALRDNPYHFVRPTAYGEYMSLSQFAKDEPAFYKNILLKATDMTARAMQCLNGSRRLPADEAAVFMTRKKSPRYPCSLIFLDKGHALDNSLYWHYYEGFKSRILDGQRPVTFMKGFVKREPKKIEKIYGHSPRTILCVPMEMTHLGYELFRDQHEKMMASGMRGENPCWGGTSKFYFGWNKLAKRLGRFPHKFDGDCKNWDRSYFTALFKAVKNIRAGAFSEITNDLLLFINFYYKNISQSPIVGSLGDVFMKLMGQPSGQFNTMTDNSIGQVILWCYHWLVFVVPRVHSTSPTWESFMEHVELVVMGDDVIYSCSQEVVQWMTPDMVDITFTSLGFGLKYVSSKPRPMDELEFCSTGFRKEEEGVYVPFLHFDKLMASLCYGNQAKINPSLPESVQVRRTLIRLMALRIEGYWNIEFRDLIDEAIQWFVADYRLQLQYGFVKSDSDPLSGEQIQALYFTHYEMRRLYGFGAQYENETLLEYLGWISREYL